MSPNIGGRPRPFAGLGIVVVAVVVIGAALALRAPGGPSGGSIAPVTAATDDGMFRLELTTPRGSYDAGEPIEPVAAVTYLGPENETTIYHAQSPVGWSIEEVGGDRKMSGVMGDPCLRTTLIKNVPLTFGFTKSGVIQDPFDEAWYRDPIVRLPAGTWRIRAFFDAFTTDGTSTCGGPRHRLEVDNVVVVGLATPPSSSSTTPASASPAEPAETPTPAPSADPESDDGTFRVELTVPKTTYTTDEAIEPVATLTYLGADGKVTYGHGEPALFFTITEIDGANRQMGGGADDVCSITTLPAGRPSTIPFFKSGQLDIGFDRAWFEDPVLRLPEGMWQIGARFEAYVPECGADNALHELTADVIVSVVSAP